MKSIVLTIVISLLYIGSLSSQSITKSVISSAGTSQAKNGITLDWTLGQLSIGYAKSGQLVQAGFQSSDDELILLDNDGIIQAKIFPNPFSSTLNIEIELVSDLKIKIYNIDGQLIHVCPSNEANQIINTAGWSVGTYILAIEAPSNYKITEKLIKYDY